MTYKHLPPVGSLTLPRLEARLDGNSSRRYGAPVRRVWDHRWGGGHIQGVIREFEHAASQASSHLVYAGETGKDAGRCVQMVPFRRKAWTEAFYNRTGLSVENADAIWLGHDPEGFARLARINAYLLHRFGLPPHWVRGRLISVGKGVSRHADGGWLAGNHTQCPTTDLDLWRQFVARVKAEHKHGHFRTTHWGHS